jgi:hypothetical protein
MKNSGNKLRRRSWYGTTKYGKFKQAQTLEEKVFEEKTIIPALRRLRQEDGEIEANLGCIVRPCLRKSKIKKEGRKNERLRLKTGKQ